MTETNSQTIAVESGQVLQLLLFLVCTLFFLEKQVDYNGRCHKVPANKRSLRIKYKLRDSHPIIMAVVLLNKSRGSRGSGLEPLFKELPFCPSQVQRCGLSDMLSFSFLPFFGGMGGGGGGRSKTVRLCVLQALKR